MIFFFDFFFFLTFIYPGKIPLRLRTSFSRESWPRGTKKLHSHIQRTQHTDGNLGWKNSYKKIKIKTVTGKGELIIVFTTNMQHIGTIMPDIMNKYLFFQTCLHFIFIYQTKSRYLCFVVFDTMTLNIHISSSFKVKLGPGVVPNWGTQEVSHN